MSSLFGLGARGMASASSWLAKIAQTATRYAPQVLDFAAQAAPVAGQGLDFLVNKFSKSKQNFNFGEVGTKLKESYNQSRENRMNNIRRYDPYVQNKGGRPGFPLFEDEMDTDQNYNNNSGLTPMSRRQFGRGSMDFFENYRDDNQDLEDTFDNAYQSNRGFKRSFNVYNERSFGSGYGRNSTFISGNEMTRGRKGFNDEDDTDDYVSQMRQEYEPSYKRRREFIRRQSDNTTSRYGRNVVQNLNFEEDDWSSMI